MLNINYSINIYKFIEIILNISKVRKDLGRSFQTTFRQ